MQILSAILKKISNEGDNTVKTLCDLMPLSYAEIYEKYHDIISDDEARILFQQAQKQKKKNRFTDAKIAAHNNPQIKNIPYLYSGQSSGLSYENDFIPDRISEHAEPGMVSSMFSPAAYLTELYREARKLHKSDSDYYLDKRRPDLKDLSLSQESLDDEISTLELSNEVLFTALKEGGDEQSVLKFLSEKYQSINLPYHEPFQIIKKVSELKEIFPIVNKYPLVINNQKTDKVWLKTIYCNLSPTLLDMLKDIYININSVQDGELDELIEKYITDDFSRLNSLKDVMNYFELTNKEFSIPAAFFGITEDANQGNVAEYKKNILKLSGVVSLYNASGLPLDTIIFILKSFNCNFFDEKAINALINLRIVRDKYQLRDDDITVLLGGNIVKDKINTDISQFDRIFNTPPLGGKTFNDSGTEVDFFTGNYTDGSEERFIINCLKRAFGMNESALATLCNFIYGQNKKINCNMEFLSLCYRTVLMAKVNNISVNELIMLFSLLPDIFNKKIFNLTSSNEVYDLLYYVNYFITWSHENKLPVLICYSLLHDSDDVIVSQGVEDVISEIKNTLNKEDFDVKSLSEDEQKEENVNLLIKKKLIIKVSPALSSVLDVSSVSAMESVLLWIDALKSEGIDIKELFFNICSQAVPLDQKYNKVIISIIKMSVMINMISIDDILLSSWVKKSALLDSSQSQLTYDFATIKMMADANSAVERAGEKSDLVISELKDSKLSYKTIANAFNQNEKIVQQAFGYLDKTENIIDYRSLTDVTTVLNSFSDTGISPDDFTKLFGNSTGSKDYAYYYNLSKTAESTLEQDKLADLKGAVNKPRSKALCALYVLDKLKDSKYKNDSTEVYKYLLIDTEISEEIKTTRIAEAISGIQLYVNNCLNNIEKEVQNSVRTRQFFCNWEEYNRRYSTWSALLMLLYYPENYIDPVIRAGKTTMMDNLQQRISQEGIKKEAIDDAFRAYLTEFDQVADLNVISAYHDEIDIEKGKTYLIGHSRLSAGNYYLRRINHEKINIKEKRISVPSFAWSDWHKIDCGMNPYNNIIRPVIFNSRLYIFWLEYSEIKVKDEPDQGEIEILFSYLRYDNTWSEVGCINLSKYKEKITDLGLSNNIDKQIGFYCSEDINGYGLLFAFYDVKSSNPDNNAFIFYFLNNNSVNEVSEDEKSKILGVVKDYFDAGDVKKVVNVHSAENINIVRESSKDTDYNVKGKSRIVSVSMTTTGLYLSSDNEKYTGEFKLQFLMKKPPLFFGDARDSQYAAYLDVCSIAQWHDHNISYSISYLVNKVTIDDDHVIDAVVFIFDRTTDSYILFLYDSRRKERIITNGNYFSEIKMRFMLRGHADDERNVTDIQSGVVIKSDATKILSYISEAGKYVHFQLKFNAYMVQSEGAEDVKLLFNNEPALMYLRATLSVDDKIITIHKLDEWCAEKKSVGNDGILYTSKDNVFSFDIEKSEVNNYKGKPVCISLDAEDSSDMMFAYKVMSKISVFDNKKDIISIKHNKRNAQFMVFPENSDAERIETHIRLNTLFVKNLVSLANRGIDYVLSWKSQSLTEPDIDTDDSLKSVLIDFNGANALYFWELFYYAPMMIADILLQHQSYNEAERWLQYIFNPAGYIEDGLYTNRYWNVMPLEEDKQWNEDEPLPDDTDPDAIALADPMHYKMATFMKTLELIIARGDKAYRELERDSLNEAKSWYIQALSLLGKEPVILLNKDWSSPGLADAANETVQSTMQRLLMSVKDTERVSDTAERSTNTLQVFFKAQLNEKLISCRDTINQRLFNLRNGLSINGQRLFLPVFSSQADPRNMLESQVNNINSERPFNSDVTLMYRFPLVIENSKNLVSQLIEFSNQLLSFNENRDNEQFTELLIHQGYDLLSQNIRMQTNEIKQLEAEKKSLLAQKSEITNRYNHYKELYSEGKSVAEESVIGLHASSGLILSSAALIDGVGKNMDLAPNIYGVATGGMKWSAPAESIAKIMEGTALFAQACADATEKSEEYRRRSQEWLLELTSAEEEEKQVIAELDAMDIQITAAKMQKHYITTEQRQNQQQLQFLQRKFTRAELYGWLRGRLMAIYSPFYDLAVSRCFMAEEAYRYEMNVNAADRSFISTSAWKGAYSGLMAGESLMLNLVQLEEAYLEKDKRVLEVTRTVSLAKLYSSMTNNSFGFDKVTELVSKGEVNRYGNTDNYVALVSNEEQTNRMELQAVIKLDGLDIYSDYPRDLGEHRLIMQISVTLPALIEPYQNVRALLEYVTDVKDERLPEGCKAIAVSHGMNDSGLFNLQFGDSTYLPFEGLSVKGRGHFKLRFFDVGDGDQKRLLQTLTDIVLHIRYTIY